MRYVLKKRCLQKVARFYHNVSKKYRYYMAHAGKWYFAYTIEGEKIVVHDACHAQNMHEEEEKE